MRRINLLIGLAGSRQLDVLSAHPKVKCSAYISGPEFEKIQVEQPQLIERIAALVKKGQLELLSSGYYEPVLSLLPDEDKVGQIQMLSRFIADNFLRPPRGLWLPEQIWEPTFPRTFSRSAIEYALLDEQLFYSAGLTLDNLSGYFITEEEGEITKVFATNKTLKDLAAQGQADELVRHLAGIATEAGDAAAVLVLEGENPGKILDRIEQEAKWIRPMTFSEYLDEFPARGRIYLPSVTSGKGYSKNILVQYPEANNLHKKMLQVSGRLRTLLKGNTLVGDQEKERRLELARRELYRGASGSVYRSGANPGLYSNAARHAAYSSLIRSEVEMDRFSRSGSPYAEVSVMDLDKDGNEEVLISSNRLNLYFAPAYGGSIYEMDYKPRAINLTNTLARRNNDPHLRFSLMDHFLAPDTDLYKFSLTDYCEAGDFVDAPYLFMPRRKGAEAGLLLYRDGKVEGIPVRVEKSVQLFSNQSIINIEYKVTNQGEEMDEFWFGVEYNFSLPDETGIGEMDEARAIKLVDEASGLDVSLESDKPALFWRFPIMTHLPSEGGLKENYQSSVVFPSWKFRLEPAQSFGVKMTLRIEE